MITIRSLALVFISLACGACALLGETNAKNPIIWADVPDVSIMRVGDTYYMSSTTMHMSPGLPIMKSHNLVNWTLIGYAYDTLVDNDEMNLSNGQDTYGRGSWASSLRFHDGWFYVSTFSATSGKTHIYKTRDIENGNWQEMAFAPDLHDHSLFFEDGRVYMVYGNGDIHLVELEADFSGIKAGGVNKVIIPNASAVAGDNIMLKAEGSQLHKINGKYYLMTITWPQDGMRTVLVHRADSLSGPYEGRVALQHQGIAQGGLVDTPSGDWYAMLFGDRGAVGRIPYLVPVIWQDGWPVFGIDGKVSQTLDIKVPQTLDISLGNQTAGITSSGIVASDEFNESQLPLAWQWNHNPDNNHWSLTERRGYLRLTSSRVDKNFLQARNTLTQRTFGPMSSASILLDVAAMRAGDVAGLGLLQKHYGYIGVKQEGDKRSLVMVATEDDIPKELESLPLEQNKVYLKAEADFRNLKDTAQFYYSLNGKEWIALGEPLKMRYTLPHFMGYRFALFNFATETPGGHVDVDYFHLEEQPAFTNGPELAK